MARVIWREFRKARVQLETNYRDTYPQVVVGKYIWGTLQDHRVMEELMLKHFFQPPEVSPHNNLYLFEHRDPRAVVQEVRQNIQAQSKLVAQLERTVKELRSRVDYFMEKTNQQRNK